MAKTINVEEVTTETEHYYIIRVDGEEVERVDTSEQVQDFIDNQMNKKKAE